MKCSYGKLVFHEMFLGVECVRQIRKRGLWGVEVKDSKQRINKHGGPRRSLLKIVAHGGLVMYNRRGGGGLGIGEGWGEGKLSITNYHLGANAASQAELARARACVCTHQRPPRVRVPACLTIELRYWPIRWGKVHPPSPPHPQTQCHAPITLLDEDIWALLKVNFGTMGADRPEFHKISSRTRGIF